MTAPVPGLPNPDAQRLAADATLAGQPLRDPMPDTSTPPEAPIESSATEKKEKIAPRFRSREEWREHMHRLADDGKWSKRNWTK